jgi:hypothetical protein
LVDTTIKPEVVDDPFVKVDMSKPELKPEMKQEPASEAKPVGENTGGNQPADTANPVQESESKSTDPGDTATPAEQ